MDESVGERRKTWKRKNKKEKERKERKREKKQSRENNYQAVGAAEASRSSGENTCNETAMLVREMEGQMRVKMAVNLQPLLDASEKCEKKM